MWGRHIANCTQRACVAAHFVSSPRRRRRRFCCCLAARTLGAARASHPSGVSPAPRAAPAPATPACTVPVAATRPRGCPASQAASAPAAARSLARVTLGGTGSRGPARRPQVVLDPAAAPLGPTAPLEAPVISLRAPCVPRGNTALGLTQRQRHVRHQRAHIAASAARVRGEWCCHAQWACTAPVGPRHQVSHAHKITSNALNISGTND